ncbi:MAG: ACP S-malonyltransferase [Lachnospiraceae bacterium]
MGKRLFMFPGQGSQYVGMGKEFYEKIPEAKEVFELASKVTGLDIPALCFEENEKINITEYTQICMLTTEAAIYAALKAKGITCDVTAGLSLGEYGALIASGAMTMEDAFKVVRQRGIYMQEAVPTGGAMSAVIGMDAEPILAICEETAKEMNQVVSIANYNCPGQIVITGQVEAVTKAGEKLTEAGAKRVIPLKVSGPFHSRMLTGAGEKLAETLKDVEIGEITVPYLANVNAEYVRSKEEVKPLLVQQVSSSVRWQQTIEKLIAEGVDEFVEIGPGRSLTGFIKKIDRSLNTVNIDKLEDFEKYVNQ